MTQTVGHGQRIGRTIGIPTVNLAVPGRVLVPKHGVYVSRVYLPDGRSYAGVTNVGTRPTFPGRGVSVETHIFDFDGDVYGAHMQLKFCARIRAERRFEDAAALRAQLREDEYEARTFFKQYKG